MHLPLKERKFAEVDALGSAKEAEYLKNKETAIRQAELQEMKLKKAENKKNKKLRAATNWSLLGLLTSVFCGAGILFSIIGLSMGCGKKKEKCQLKSYAVGLGVAGLVCSLGFLALTAYCVIEFLL